MSYSYERDMSIDVQALDVEWTEQAELAMKYGRMWAEAQDTLERANENVKLIKAELNVRINENPEKLLGEGVKATVANVEACILQHVDYQQAREAWLDALKQSNLLSVAKNEISFTRKSALENLVILHGQSYFAGPNVPRNLKVEVDKKRENQKANAEMKKIERRRN
jgi:hypothetical protein